MLKLCKILLAKLHLWPLDVSPSMQTISISHYTLNLLIEFTVFTASLIYVLQNLQDIDEATEPGFACFAFLTSMFIYVWLISKKHLIGLAVEHLESCISKSKYLFFVSFHLPFSFWNNMSIFIFCNWFRIFNDFKGIF